MKIPFQSVTASSSPPTTGAATGTIPCTLPRTEKKRASSRPVYKSVAIDRDMTRPPAPARPCMNR